MVIGKDKNATILGKLVRREVVIGKDYFVGGIGQIFEAEDKNAINITVAHGNV